MLSNARPYLQWLVPLLFSLLVIACGGGGGGSGGDGGDGGNAMPSSPRASLIVDVNNDGLNDLVIDTGDSDSVSSAHDLLLINQGGLSFESRPDAFPARSVGTGDYGPGVTVAFSEGDFNGDGQVDIILIGVSEFYEESHLQLFFGDGEGGFTDGSDQITPNTFFGWPEWIRVADFDGDGFDDFVLTTSSICEAYCGKIYLNDGSGNLAPATINFTDVSGNYSSEILTWDTSAGQDEEPYYLRPFTDILLGDVNNDIKPDLVALPYWAAAIPSFINTSTPGVLSFDVDYSIVTADGGAHFHDTQPQMKNGVLADLNGDGFPDLVGSKSISAVDGETTPVHAYLNDGTGVFDLDNDLVVSGVGVYHARQWQAADVDGDGYDEVIIADHGEDYYPYSGRPNLLLNMNVSGDVIDRADTALSAGRSFSHGLASGDLNGDGAVDLFFNNDWFEEMGTEREAFIWINEADGSGEFEQAYPTLN